MSLFFDGGVGAVHTMMGPCPLLKALGTEALSPPCNCEWVLQRSPTKIYIFLPVSPNLHHHRTKHKKECKHALFIPLDDVAFIYLFIFLQFYQPKSLIFGALL